jgi:hypothetical protein
MAVLLTAEGPPLSLRRSQPNGAAPGGVLNLDIQRGLTREGPPAQLSHVSRVLGLGCNLLAWALQDSGVISLCIAVVIPIEQGAGGWIEPNGGP